jgi:hypothetical protein
MTTMQIIILIFCQLKKKILGWVMGTHLKIKKN